MATLGGSLSDLVKLTVYLSDMRAWPACRETIVGRLGASCPALTPVAVGKFLVPGRSVELEAWAATPNDPSRPVLAADNAAWVDMHGPLLIISGEGAIPIYVGGKAADIYKYRPDTDIADQARVSMENYKAILEASGSSWDRVFKTTWYVNRQSGVGCDSTDCRAVLRDGFPRRPWWTSRSWYSRLCVSNPTCGRRYLSNHDQAARG